jgi:hypothetical protein
VCVLIDNCLAELRFVLDMRSCAQGRASVRNKRRGGQCMVMMYCYLSCALFKLCVVCMVLISSVLRRASPEAFFSTLAEGFFRSESRPKPTKTAVSPARMKTPHVLPPSIGCVVIAHACVWFVCCSIIIDVFPSGAIGSSLTPKRRAHRRRPSRTSQQHIHAR